MECARVHDAMCHTTRNRKRYATLLLPFICSAGSKLAILLMLMLQNAESFVRLPKIASTLETCCRQGQRHPRTVGGSVMKRKSTAVPTCSRDLQMSEIASRSMDQQEVHTGLHTTTRNDQEWQFFDTARINVKAGDGGDGSVKHI